MSQPTVIDLFSGIGGFSLGLDRAGYRTVAFCEISPKCRHLLKHHWPEVAQYDDVKTLTRDRLTQDGIGQVDLICGGFPCQDISLAGKGAGLAGSRSGLWSEFARIIGEFRPRVVIVENVQALLVRGMGTVLGDLAALGYDAWWDCIPASAVGAPHRRDRLWIVAYARGQQHEGFGDAIRGAIAAELSGADLADAYGEPQPQERQGDGVVRRQRAPVRRGQQLAPRPGAGSRDFNGRDAAGDGRLDAAASDGGDDRPAVADTAASRRGPRSCEARGSVRHASWRSQSERRGGEGGGSGFWLSEPDVGRVAHGVSARVDRLHGLGNAVVPEIPYRLGRAIMSAGAWQ